jgi:hypothetical protein
VWDSLKGKQQERTLEEEVEALDSKHHLNITSNKMRITHKHSTSQILKGNKINK